MESHSRDLGMNSHSFLLTLNLDGSSFPGQLRQERVIYLKRKPYNVPFESNTETGRISVMKGSRQVLVKVVLYHLRGRSQPQNDATANFFANSERPILRLSNEMRYHLLQKFFGEMVKIKE